MYLKMSATIFILAALLTVGESASAISVRASNDYYFASQQVTFLQAWSYCKNAGMKFVSLPTSAQNAALGSALGSLGSPTVAFWIGGIYLRNGFLTKWYWVDGQEDFSYTNWLSTPSVPTTADYCVIYNYSPTTKNGTWTTGSCSLAKYFICQS